MGDRVEYVIVRNMAHSLSFALYESLAIRTRLVADLGAREVDMPRLQDWLVEALNRENLTITAALKHPAVSLLDRQRLRTWQRRVYSSLEEVRDLLTPKLASPLP